MKKIASLFIIAVLVPSFVLAWLAILSLNNQQAILEKQQILLQQKTANFIADEIRDTLAAQQREFADEVEHLLTSQEINLLLASFDRLLPTQWSQAEIGFIVSHQGKLLTPTPRTSSLAHLFWKNHHRFLESLSPATIYPHTSSIKKKPPQSQPFSSEKSLLLPERTPPIDPPHPRIIPLSFPAHNAFEDTSVPIEITFNHFTQAKNSGAFTRLLSEGLAPIFWYRSPRYPQFIFGAQLSMSSVQKLITSIIEQQEGGVEQPLNQIAVVLLDQKGQPVVLSPPDFQGDWHHPLVATEIGNFLPHWEVTIHLLHPEAIYQTASTLRWILAAMIVMMLAAIGSGSWLIFSDLRRQLHLVSQKTDFVSNVSHELKTPLTSIRMFADLLMESDIQDSVKRRNYLEIISEEASRLTRLINNVLDFSRIERSIKKYSFEEKDLTALVQETVENYRPHLESHGYTLQTNFSSRPIPVSVDTDALAQILLNLLSNAEKYGGDARSIIVETAIYKKRALVRVIDHGKGVPAGSEKAIFEKFYRAHDSLSNSIQGTGLGLTLARQIARAHHGELSYTRSSQGGSCFTLTLPLLCPSRSPQDR